MYCGTQQNHLGRSISHTNGSSIVTERTPFFGNTVRQVDDNESRRIHYFQCAISMDDRFSGALLESIHTTIQIYELPQQYELIPTQMAEIFVHAISGPVQLLFLREISQSDSYQTIPVKILHEYNSDARQSQIDVQLAQQRLRKFMHEQGITDISKELTALVTRIDELIPQCQVEFQTDLH